ncbi:hypothetical protein DXG01_017191 [Tephrocybe rancida]|nr:hypothetical protein DXG01_017191 [Tephrocybe rancida]
MSHSFSGSGSVSPIKFPVVSGLEPQEQPLSTLRKKLDDSMENLFIGPMPVEQFLQEFMPQAGGRPVLTQGYFSSMPKATQENAMYEPYIDLINQSGLIPGYKLVNTSYHYDKDSTSGPKLKPDPSMYQEALDVTAKVTQFGELELHSELKPDASHDAFCDPKPGVDRRKWDFRNQSLAGKRSRSQLIHYATEWFSRQHRHHGFTIFLFGQYIRFIRWDRAGAVVSERFDFKNNSGFLIDFLWRFSHLDAAGRGKDPYVRRADPSEVEIAHTELAEWKPKAERPVIVFTIDIEGGESRHFIAWGCMSEPSSLIGRCTRAYPVYELATNQKYFLKDGWRAHSLAREADILKRLQDKKVEHVPIYICGGDIRGGVTKTDLFVTVEEAEEAAVGEKQASGNSSTAVTNSVENSINPEQDANSASDIPSFPGTSKLDGSFKCGMYWKRITQRYHHRFITDVIGKPLNTFTSSKHMMQVVSNAFTAHRQAYELAGVIHRDVSSNNILITLSGGGILNDWDMAKLAADLEKGPRQHERTVGRSCHSLISHTQAILMQGTWEFMSCLLLSGHHTVNTIQDDMESFVLIVLYHALRYFPHNQRSETQWILSSVFSNKVLTTKGYRGYEARKSLFQNKVFITKDFQLVCPPLDMWVEEAIQVVKEWIDTEEAQKPAIQSLRARGPGVLSTLRAGRSSELPPTLTTTRFLDDHQVLVALFSSCLTALDWPDPTEDVPVDVLPLLEAEQKPEQREAGTKELGGTSGSTKRSRTSTDIGGTGESSKRSKTSTTNIGRTAGPSRKSKAFSSSGMLTETSGSGSHSRRSSQMDLDNPSCELPPGIRTRSEARHHTASKPS